MLINKDACSQGGVRSMSETTFRETWKSLVPYILTAKPQISGNTYSALYVVTNFHCRTRMYCCTLSA